MTEKTHKRSISVLYFGSYDPSYSRNRIIIRGLERHKVNVFECRTNGLIFFRYPKLLICFLKNFRKIKAIIIGFPGHYDVPLAFLLGKIFRKKVFYDIFASTYETYVLDREVIKKDSLRSRFFYFIDWFGLKLADYVIIDTLAHGKFYSKLYGLSLKKQILVYVGSDTDYFFPRNVKEETDVLFYGSYQPLQGVDVIIKAAAKISKINFRLIGNGKTRKQSEDLAKSLRLRNIEFIDWISLHKLAVELNKSKIILGIFGRGIKAQSVIPNKVYDALATRKPIISSDTQAARELLNDSNAILIEPDDGLVLAQAIMNLMGNEPKMQKMAQNGYKLFAKRLKPDKVVKNVISKINEK